MVRVFTILLVTMFLMGLVFQATQAALPKVFDLRLRDIAGEGAFGIGVIVAIVYTAGGLMQLAGGFLADRWPLKPLYIASWLFQIPVYGVIAAASGLPLIAVAILAVLLGAGALPAENMLLARYTPEHHRSLAFGVKYVLAFGSGPFAIWLVSVVNETTGEFVWLFAMLAAMAAAATIAALWLPGEWRRPAPAAAE
jgi:MFS family permease